MASTQTSLLNCNFGGISRKDSSFSSDLITCSDCQNVELYYTGLNSGVGIRTTKGNEAITKIRNAEGILVSVIPEDENVIEIFDSYMGGVSQFIVYTENETNGKLYIFNKTTKALTLYKTFNYVTGMACGCDFNETQLDIFCFSNGEEFQYLSYDPNSLGIIEAMDMSQCNFNDPENRTVKGLGMYSFDSRLWVFNGKTLWYSEQGNCKNFHSDTSGYEVITDAGYIDFVKQVTAIYPYLGTLAVFHKDSSALINVDTTTRFSKSDESPGGCASYKSLVFHGTDLFFYDDTKKGVFSFRQVVNGDKTLGDNIAYDIQSELIRVKDVDKIRTLSVVTSDRNEVWFLLPINETYDKEIRVFNEETQEWETQIIQLPASIVMIFDYIRGAWIKRKCQRINCIAVVDSILYSGNKEIYQEYTSKLFDNDFIPCEYECTTFNLGADNTLKITKFPPRINADGSYNCNFWVRYKKNYNDKKLRTKNVKAKYTNGNAKWNDGTKWDDGTKYPSTSTNYIVKLPSITSKALQITFFTTKEEEEFCFRSIEMSRIKVKQV